MEEDLFSLAAGKQPSQQAKDEAGSQAGEPQESAAPVQPGKTKEDVRNRVDYLRSELRRHNRLYYEQAEPEISDAEYDALFLKLEKLEKAHHHCPPRLRRCVQVHRVPHPGCRQG